MENWENSKSKSKKEKHIILLIIQYLSIFPGEINMNCIRKKIERILKKKWKKVKEIEKKQWENEKSNTNSK
jgi:hypothetical protein